MALLTRSFLPVRATVLAALVLLTLSACDRVDKLEEGVSTEVEVRKQFGDPVTVTVSPDGKRVAFAPENAASLWTTYNFTGALAGLEAGLGVTYQGDVALNPANTGFAPEYTSLDALISYGWDRYRVSLNAYNLTDELYYSQVQNNRLVPAPERNFVMTLGVVF